MANQSPRGVRDQATQLAVLHEITRVVGSSLDLNAVYETFVSELRKLVDFNRASVILIDEPGGNVDIYAMFTDRPSELGIRRRLPLKGTGAEWVAANRKPLIQGDLAQDRLFPADEILIREGFRSAMRIPLFSKGEVFGTFNLSSRQPDQYSEEDLEILEEVAGILAGAVENDRLFSSIRQQNRELSILNAVARAVGQSLDLGEILNNALKTVLGELELDMGVIYLRREKRRILDLRSYKGMDRDFAEMESRLRFGECLCGMAARAGEPVVTGDLSEEPRCSRGTCLGQGLRSFAAVPLWSKRRVVGVMGVGTRTPQAFSARDVQLLSSIGNQIGVAVENGRLITELMTRQRELETAYRQLEDRTASLERGRRELENAYLGMGRTLTIALEARDQYSRGHSERVAHLARTIALNMGLPQSEVQTIEIAARLHDIGKIAIPDGILLKPTGLLPSEMAEVQLHPRRGVELLRFLDFLEPVLPIVEAHHEHYDGSGYPNSLRGEQIPLGARILAVADGYDAMTSARPYRPAISHEQALENLRKEVGVQWDPQVVEVFLRAYGLSA